MDRIIKGFRIAYTEEGKGHTVLFVHGYPLSRRIWDPQVHALSSNYRIIAPDLPGHGDSEPVSGPYTMDFFADVLKDLLDSMGIHEKVALCGLSMGGYVSFAFLRKIPERLSGLILTATRAADDSPQGKLARDQAADNARTRGIEAIVHSMLPRMFAPDTMAQKPVLVSTVREIMSTTSLNGVLGDLAALKSRQDSRPLLGSIKCPVLVLHGSEDQIVPLQEAEEMQAAVPNSKFHQIPGAGHLLNLEHPAHFNQALQDFLQNLDWKD